MIPCKIHTLNIQELWYFLVLPYLLFPAFSHNFISTGDSHTDVSHITQDNSLKVYPKCTQKVFCTELQKKKNIQGSLFFLLCTDAQNCLQKNCAVSNRTYVFSAPVDISHIYSLESSQMLEKYRKFKWQISIEDQF